MRPARSRARQQPIGLRDVGIYGAHPSHALRSSPTARPRPEREALQPEAFDPAPLNDRPFFDLTYYGSSVTAFSTDDILGNRLDFEIARDGFVCRLHVDAALRNAETWLRREGYRVIELDSGAWREAMQMHIAFATALQFPSHYGKNLSALNDCMSDVAEAEYGWDPTETGLVLILSGFDDLAQRLPRIADHVKQILARQGRYAALFGNRLLTILS